MKKFTKSHRYAATFQEHGQDKAETIIFRSLQHRQRWLSSVMASNHAFLHGQGTVYFHFEMWEIEWPDKLKNLLV